jgi:hypothetical protein
MGYNSAFKGLIYLILRFLIMAVSPPGRNIKQNISTWCKTGSPHSYLCHQLFGPSRVAPWTLVGEQLVSSTSPAHSNNSLYNVPVPKIDIHMDKQSVQNQQAPAHSNPADTESRYSCTYTTELYSMYLHNRTIQHVRHSLGSYTSTIKQWN